MCSSLLAFFIALIGLQLIICENPSGSIFDCYLEHTYKIHPLLIIVNEKIENSLLLPDKLDSNGVPILTQDQQLYLHCCGYNNRIAATKTQQIDIINPIKRSMGQSKKCSRTFIKFLPGKFIKNQYENAFCLSPMLASINNKLRNKKCALNDRGTLMEAGFKVRHPVDEGSFFKLYSICFSEDLRSAIYTTHNLIGSELLFPENKESCDMPKIYIGKLYKNLSVASPYHPAVQEKIFLSIFGPIHGLMYLSIRDVNGTLYTAAPLTPPGDFYFPPHKTATNVFDNTLPVFNNILKNEISIVEELGRLLAYQVKSRKLFVVSGAFLKLELPLGKNGTRSIELDLHKDKRRYRPIPKFLYKIYYDADSKKGIAFVTINNPYSKFSEEDFPCSHIGIDFINIDYFISMDGILRNTVYCRVPDLMEKVKDIPHLDVKGNLYLNIYDKTLPKNHQLPKNYRVIIQK